MKAKPVMLWGLGDPLAVLCCETGLSKTTASTANINEKTYERGGFQIYSQ